MAKLSPEIRERYKKLQKLARYHQELYHTKDEPEITDEAYDSLAKELTELEEKYPKLKVKGGVSERVGGKIIEGFKKAHHKVRQYSLDNVFNYEELQKWEEKILRILDKEGIKEKPQYVAELKIDGLKIVLTYVNGKLNTAVTRGDGVMGEDVTENVKTIKSVPLEIPKKGETIVSGEIWMPYSEFERINEERKKASEPLFANPRNSTAGTIRQLDTGVTASRRLETFIYDLEEEGLNQVDELNGLTKLGFQVNPYVKEFNSLDEIEKHYKKWSKDKKKVNYGVDGLVVKVNQKNLQNILGFTGKSPRFAVAYKFPAEQSTTVVKDIVLQVGRT
jgi:DNA ligase (NAD+)